MTRTDPLRACQRARNRARQRIRNRARDHPAPLMGASDIRRLAEEIGVRPTKTLGQNFVIDGNTIRRIVTAAAIRAG